MSRQALRDHILEHAIRTDGPFILSSGATSDWYLDARQTTFSGQGSQAVAQCVLEVLAPNVEAVGGMTMGADPIALATALVGTSEGRPLNAFSIRKAAKDHGTGGRLVGPVGHGSKVAIVEDTTTTGGAIVDALEAATYAGLSVHQVIALVDRSEGIARAAVENAGIPYIALFVPDQLGIA